jgi:aldehyde dehydrogenase (NAD+)
MFVVTANLKRRFLAHCLHKRSWPFCSRTDQECLADTRWQHLPCRRFCVDKVTFTGSTAASICGERIARCTLELGGKSAAVILDDYDVGTAAKTIAGRATYLTGQVCSSLTRIVVTRKRHDALVEALSAAFQNVKVGDPFDPSCQMGPLAMSRQRDRVEGYIDRGKAEGATHATGRGRPAQPRLLH